jgi:hypothetical protein
MVDTAPSVDALAWRRIDADPGRWVRPHVSQGVGGPRSLPNPTAGPGARCATLAPMARTPGTFIGYPTDHMLAVFSEPTAAAQAAAAVVAAGIPDRHVQILRGPEGARRLDGTGASHGRMARTRRLVSFTLMDQLPDMAWYERAVLDGGAVVMVRVRGDATKGAVLAALLDHGGHFINYYGRFATEELARWRGPEPRIPSLLKR